MIPRSITALALSAFTALLLLGTPLAPVHAQLVRPSSVQFDQFVADLWKDAQAKGISRITFAKAFADVTPDARVIAMTKRQPEYNKPAGAYVTSIASAQNAKEGLRKEAQWRPTFEAVEKRFRVERWVILAIWGME